MLKQKPALKTKKSNLNSQSQFISKFFYLAAKTVFSQHFISISILVAVTIWTVWLTLSGPARALANLITNWEAAVTMIFGFMVAGGTSNSEKERRKKVAST